MVKQSLPEQARASVDGIGADFELDNIDDNPVRSVATFKSNGGKMLEKRVYDYGSVSYELYEKSGGTWVFVGQMDESDVTIE